MPERTAPPAGGAYRVPPAAWAAFRSRVASLARAADEPTPYDQLRLLVLDLHEDDHPGPARHCDKAACQHAAGLTLGGTS